MGYHVRDIKKGTLGDFSKIAEEMAELTDAHEQSNPVMMLIEMSDLIGAMKAYLKKNCGNIKIEDLIVMQKATERAFQDGSRT